MTIQQLRYMITVAEKGSITEAAKFLFISQPSLSDAVRQVEKEAGVTIYPLSGRCSADQRRDGIFGICASGGSADGAAGSKIHQQ